MLHKIPAQHHQGGFFHVLYPQGEVGDSGVGSIGRIDHPYVNRNIVVPMHPHKNDEILSYFRTGLTKHTDSQQISDTVHGTRLMLMKAGEIYYHEEQILGATEAMEGLQIFVRPRRKDDQPEVSFRDLDSLYSDNAWRLLASGEADSELRFTSRTWVYDVRLTAEHSLALPDFDPNLTYLLYVFQGNAKVNGIELGKRDSVLIRDENVQITADEQAELVLFVTDEQAEIYKNGMFSGNQM